MWITDPKSKEKSATLTIFVFVTLLTAFTYLFGGSTIKIGSSTINIPSVDISFFVAAAGTYVGRRNIRFGLGEYNGRYSGYDHSLSPKDDGLED